MSGAGRRHALRALARGGVVALGLALAPLALPARAADANTPAEGIDYALIPDGKPFDAAARGIEVAEVFAYWCPHCAHFRAPLAAWAKTLPKGAHLIYVPAVGRPDDAFPMAFFAAQSLGAEARTHDAVFAAVHDQQILPANASEDELVQFYAGLGLDTARFRAAMQSPAVATELARARTFEDTAGIEGVPTLVVAGKYRVLAPDYDGMLATARWLVERELRAAQRGR
jgi:thiol:disulfide interchange protein DsbA